MNLKSLIPSLFLALSFTSAFAADKVEAGPKGGRLLGADSPRPEFFVNKDRTVTITFYGEDKRPVSPGTQVVTAIAEAKSGKKTLEFEKRGETLVSKTPLPEGEPYTVVLQLRASPEARPKNFRIPLNLSECGGCKHGEYACTCDE